MYFYQLLRQGSQIDTLLPCLLILIGETICSVHPKMIEESVGEVIKYEPIKSILDNSLLIMKLKGLIRVECDFQSERNNLYYINIFSFRYNHPFWIASFLLLKSMETTIWFAKVFLKCISLIDFLSIQWYDTMRSILYPCFPFYHLRLRIKCPRIQL